MRRPILASLLMIGLAITLVVGATAAWFTGSATVGEHEFQAGTLKIMVTGSAFDVANMAPGNDPAVEYVTVKNTGSLDLLLKAALIDDETTENGLKDALHLAVTLNPEDYPQGYHDLELYGSTEKTIFDQPLAEFARVDNFDTWLIDNLPLAPGSTAVYKLEVSLPQSTGNSYQGKSYKANLRFDAVQMGGI